MAHKKFEIANGTTYQEYLYTDGVENSKHMELTKQNYSPVINPYTYYYTGSFEIPYENVSSVEITEVEVGSQSIRTGMPIVEFGYGGAYYNHSDNTINFYGGSDTLYPTGSGTLMMLAVGKVKYKVTQVGQELYGEIYNKITIDEEEMMPMSNTVEDNNTEMVDVNDYGIDGDGYGVAIWIDNTSNSFPVYITFDSGHVGTSDGIYGVNDDTWRNQAVAPGESKTVWYCDVHGESVTSADIFITLHAPGYRDCEIELEL